MKFLRHLRVYKECQKFTLKIFSFFKLNSFPQYSKEDIKNDIVKSATLNIRIYFFSFFLCYLCGHGDVAFVSWKLHKRRLALVENILLGLSAFRMKCLTRTIYLFVLQAHTERHFQPPCKATKGVFSHSCIFHFHFLFNKFLLAFLFLIVSSRVDYDVVGSYSDLVTIELVEGFFFHPDFLIGFLWFLSFLIFLPCSVFLGSFLVVWRGYVGCHMIIRKNYY